MKTEKRKYKYLVASDLDGTLLAKADTISEENRDAIKKMAEAEVCFAPCSGRTFYEMPLCIRNNPNIRYYIGADGSAAWEKSDDKITKIVDLSMNREQACQMFDILDKY